MLVFCTFAGIAQNKSTNIQTIDGKKYYIHKVEKSQSLYAISKLYSVGLDEIYTVNPELKNGAKINQEIKIPVNSLNTVATPSVAVTATNAAIDTTKFYTHKIQKGETMYSLTKKYNNTEKQLLAYNPTLSQGLKDGQVIIVGEKPRKKTGNAATVKDKKPEEPKPVVLVKEIKQNAPVVDSSAFKPVSKPRKTSYNVALILPFRLDATINMDLNELVKTNSNFPTVPALAIDFYLGFKRAMDSLISKDYEINLEVYDIDDKDSIKIIELAASSRFKDLDLIFGPLYANGFKTIAKKAKELHIPIVSPITRENKILYNNIYISKTNPSQFTLLESMVSYCIDSLKTPGSRIILMQLSDKDKKEAQFVSACKKQFNEYLKAGDKNSKDSILMARGIYGLKQQIAPGARNIVILLSNNQVLTTDFITQLSIFSDKKDVILCGWESLRNTENIDQEYLNQLNYTFAHQYNLTNTSAYNPLLEFYRQQQESTPSEYFYIGFDIAYYYLSNLKDKGPDFIYNLNTLPLETNYLNFKFTRPDNYTGFDNRGVYIFKYKNYQLQKTGWK
ncbi:MAG: LysM peptidoglycan-binding domain-containing protein [Bacteroidia bacterium]|nr:LysM peptidoglycan-binding domain-containing protein [Bacteroidia bacterium]